MNGFWINNKNSKVYTVTGVRRNCTNDRDGQVMVDYELDRQLFCREMAEFKAKFTKFLPEVPLVIESCEIIPKSRLLDMEWTYEIVSHKKLIKLKEGLHVQQSASDPG